LGTLAGGGAGDINLLPAILALEKIVSRRFFETLHGCQRQKSVVFAAFAGV
jgi:hypothetical protein